jgi:hypothetical protein
VAGSYDAVFVGAMLRSAPSCLAASTASRPTAPSSTTATVLPGPDVGGDRAEPAGAEHIGGSQQAADQVQVRLAGRGDRGAVQVGAAAVVAGMAASSTGSLTKNLGNQTQS